MLRPSAKINVEFPIKARVLFQDFMPDGRPVRYVILHGGRGSTKSWSVARYYVLKASTQQCRVLCARETQASIKESVHQLLKEQISLLGLEDKFKVTETSIECKSTGADFIFAGLRTDPQKVKSTEGITDCWVEEAAKVSKESWKYLIPTIRKTGSKIVVTFNPDEESDETSKRHIERPARPDEIRVQMNWQDNPWFKSSPLVGEKDYDYAVDPETAHHVWGGGYRKHAKAAIFGPQLIDGVSIPKVYIEAFEPGHGWSGPYYGLDHGFATDPVAGTKSWIYNGDLFIEYEAFGVGVELNQIGTLLEKKIPGIKLYREINGQQVLAPQQPIVRCDNSRPETIVHLQGFGFNTVSAAKWPGCVEDRITVLRAFRRIVIHPRCERMEEESRMYRYKVDKITGEVLPIVIDKWNHGWDAVGYSLEEIIKQETTEEMYSPAVIHSIADELDELDDFTGPRVSNW